MSGRAWPAAAGVLALAAAASAAGPARVHGPPFPTGAPPGVTGGFGEPTCQQCHFGAPLNDSAGSFTIEGLPERYAPGETYRLVLRLRRPQMAAAGFQLSARTADGVQAGVLAAVDSTAATQTVPETRIQYAGQSERGSLPAAPDAAGWAIEWTAPARLAGPVTFSAAANAADGDASPLGDYVYALQRALPPR